MAKPNTYPYCFFYNDNTHLVFDITKADYEKMKESLLAEPRPHAVELSLGIVVLQDIRSVIEQKVEEQEPLEIGNPLSDAESIVYQKMLAEQEELERGLLNA